MDMVVHCPDPSFRTDALISQQRKVGRLTAHSCVPFCGLKKSPWPKDMPLPMTRQWEDTKDYPSSRAFIGSADTSIAIASEFNFTLCPILFPSLLHRCWSQRDPQINFLHANLYLRVDFLGNSACDTPCNVKRRLLCSKSGSRRLVRRPGQLSKPETLVAWSSTIDWRYLLDICGYLSGDVG